MPSREALRHRDVSQKNVLAGCRVCEDGSASEARRAAMVGERAASTHKRRHS
jgi:hypothetical protein